MNSILLVPMILMAPVFFQEEAQEPDYDRLIDQLTAEYQDERTKAFEDLKTAGKKAETALVENVGHDDFRVRKVCLELLTNLKSKKVIVKATGLFRDDDDATVQVAAFAYLQMCGKDAKVALLHALDHDEEMYILGAISTIEKEEIQDEEIARQLDRHYQDDPESTLGKAALRGLKKQGIHAKSFFMKMLDKDDEKVRLDGLEGLLSVKGDDVDVVKKVSERFQTETSELVQRKAFDYLRTKGKRAEEAFLKGLDSKIEAIRSQSIDGLRESKSETALEKIGGLFQKDESKLVREKALDYLKSLGLKAEAALLSALENKNAKVRLMAIDGLGVIKSAKPLARISKLFREDEDTDVHKVAFAYLKNVGAPAETDLIHALRDTLPEIQREAIQTLGHLKSEKAIDPLVALLGEIINNSLQTEVRDALVRIGGKAVEAAQAAAEAGTLGKKHAKTISDLFRMEEVEGLLGDFITEEYGTGTFAGQFDRIKKYGAEKALPVLLKLADPEQPLRRAEGHEYPTRYARYLRELAILAIGELGDKSALTGVQTLLKDGTMDTESHRFALVATAYRLGDKTGYDKFVKEQTARANEETAGENRNYRPFYSLAQLQNRIGEREGALKTYERIRKGMEEDQEKKKEIPAQYEEVLYNIACLHALAGSKSEALDVLEKSIKAGFRDKAWIQMDGDLTSLREDEGFKALLAKDDLYQKKDGN